jgi:hypothetical protein
LLCRSLRPAKVGSDVAANNGGPVELLPYPNIVLFVFYLSWSQEGVAMMCTKFTWSLAVWSAVWIRTVPCDDVTPGAWDAFLAELDAADAAVKAG